MNTSKLVWRHIQKKPKGAPFTTGELLKFGSYANIRQILSRLVKSQKVLRIAQGLFVRPKKVPYIGYSLPEPKAVAEAIAETTGEKIGISGAEATQVLGLSTQVPMKPVFFTTGYTRHIMVGKLEITLKHVSPKKLVHAGTKVGLVISALRYLGKENVSERTIEKIRRQLKPKEFNAILENTHHMPGWMADAFRPYRRGIQLV